MEIYSLNWPPCGGCLNKTLLSTIAKVSHLAPPGGSLRNVSVANINVVMASELSRGFEIQAQRAKTQQTSSKNMNQNIENTQRNGRGRGNHVTIKNSS